MKRSDIFLQIFSEVSGKPKEALSELLEAFKNSIPGQHNFDEDIPEREAEKLLQDLRSEKESILKWLQQGHHQFVLRNFPPAGSA